MKIRIQVNSSNYGKYKTMRVTIPKEIQDKAKWIKKQKLVDIDVDLLGNIVIKP